MSDVERDRSRDPDLEVFDHDIDWPAPQLDPAREPVDLHRGPIDDDEDRRWLADDDPRRRPDDPKRKDIGVVDWGMSEEED
jgi:hypothetical protein